jgi:hypothetical protein
MAIALTAIRDLFLPTLLMLRMEAANISDFDCFVNFANDNLMIRALTNDGRELGFVIERRHIEDNIWKELFQNGMQEIKAMAATPVSVERTVFLSMTQVRELPASPYGSLPVSPDQPSDPGKPPSASDRFRELDF